jgi:hypothetical protein
MNFVLFLRFVLRTAKIAKNQMEVKEKFNN